MTFYKLKGFFNDHSENAKCIKLSVTCKYCCSNCRNKWGFGAAETEYPIVFGFVAYSTGTENVFLKFPCLIS